MLSWLHRLLWLFLWTRCISSKHQKLSKLLRSLPLIPTSLPEVALFNESTQRHIPQRLWIAVKDRQDPLPGHWQEFFQRNSQWSVTICDNRCKDEFMETVFKNTSLYHAYHMINPLVGAARADLWRYCVLYVYGGVYMDDDSDIKTPLDDIIQREDRLIMSEEGSSSLGDCYIPSYPLSDAFTVAHYRQNFTKAKHFNGLNSRNQPIFFHDHTLINWAIFTQPRHPLFLQTLKHIHTILLSEYERISVIHMTRWDVRWKQVMCSTGFTLTFTLRELELQQALPTPLLPRISTNNFREYKGNVKAIWTGNDPTHYMKAMNKKNGPLLLHEYASLDWNKILTFLNHRTVMGDLGKEIYLIFNGKKYTFGSYEIFLRMNFTDTQTRHVSDLILSQIPSGGDMTLIKGFEESFVESQRKASQGVVTSWLMGLEPNINSLGGGGSNSSGITLKESKRSLKHALKVLNNQSIIPCFRDDYDGTRDDLLRGKWSTILGELPALVFPFCLNTYQLGNTLGYYLNNIACAEVTGAHFLAVQKHFVIQEPDRLQAQGRHRHAFFEALPDMILHNEPRDLMEVKRLLPLKCDCLQYCWENPAAPWRQKISVIGQVLLPAIQTYLQRSEAHSHGMIVNNLTDLSNAPTSMNLPFLPNVTIQYRCGDNVGFGKTRYGLLPFRTFSPQRIPADFRSFIYVIADSPSRSPHSPYSNRCDIILKEFFEYLRKKFPSSIIVIKRGGDAFLDVARIALSSIVFCSASTFCLWPALANHQGTIFYPLTPLILGAKDNQSAPHLAHNFHWIDDVDMIKNFKQYHPWTRLLDDLKSP